MICKIKQIGQRFTSYKKGLSLGILKWLKKIHFRNHWSRIKLVLMDKFWSKEQKMFWFKHFKDYFKRIYILAADKCNKCWCNKGEIICPFEDECENVVAKRRSLDVQ